MARREVRLLVSIWEDPDFLALSPMGQRLYMFLISQPDLAHDGVIALRERRWSKKAAGLSAERITDSLEELSAARFVILDEDTEELLVRSFIRSDKVYRQPNVLRAAADHLATVSSPAIRYAVALELIRIQTDAEDIPEGSKGVLAGMLAAIGNPSPNPSGNPSIGSPEGHLKRQGPIPGIGGVKVAVTGLGAAVAGSSALGPADHPEAIVSAGGKGSPNPSGNPSAKGSGLPPGERGVVTAVGSASPNPVPRSTSPVPREAAARPPRADARGRGTRIPDDFAVTPELVTWAHENAPDVNGSYETAKFVDYWRARSGKDATKVDWPATWKNWIRKAQEDIRRPRGPATGANRHTKQRHDNPFTEQ